MVLEQLGGGWSVGWSRGLTTSNTLDRQERLSRAPPALFFLYNEANLRELVWYNSGYATLGGSSQSHVEDATHHTADWVFLVFFFGFSTDWAWKGWWTGMEHGTSAGSRG